MIFFKAERNSPDRLTLTDQIVIAIEDSIQNRRLRPGARLPSIRQFAAQYGVSTFTVASAYSRLVAAGLVTSRPGAGYRVSSPATPVTQRAPAKWRPPAVGASWLLADVFADHSIPIKSGCGWLPSEWLNETGLRQALRHASRIPAKSMGGYGHPYGFHPLREQIARNMADYGLELSTENLLLTQGATQGLDIIIKTLLKAGDTVLVEVPAYANLLHALRMANINIVGVRRTTNGLCIEELESKVSGNKIKALFVNPVLHNPTGTNMTMENAFKVLQIAERHDFWVIEDDVSRDLLQGAGAMLASMAGLSRVVYVSGFSKSITPALRVGYMAATEPLIQEFAKTKMTFGLTTPEIMERAVLQVLRQGKHGAHLDKVIERLRQAHDVVADRLNNLGMEIFAQPRAGLFLWARPKVVLGGANYVAQKALEHGIWLAPGSYFFPPGSANKEDDEWIRFNVAYSNEPKLWEFLGLALNT